MRADPKKDRHGRKSLAHRGNCPAKNKSKHQPTPIHLYRELKSEAIRFLLPFSTEDAKKREANVRAAIRLGLKTLYGGDPEFLGVDIYDQPQAGNNEARRRYLIIQDMVPGGTGLLAELAMAKGEKLKEALELSLQRLRQCGCNKRDPAVRACYQCLYAYREQDDLHLLDRDTACSLLETMLEAFSDLTKVENGLAGVSIDSLLESELERRLYSRLVNLTSEDADFQVVLIENEVLDIQVAGRHWRVTPQKYIDPARTSVPCRPDLLIEPIGQERDVRPVALFADGLEYHVRPSERSGRIADDVNKRGELLKTGRYLVWSMSWWDVDAENTSALVPPWIAATSVSSAEKLTSKLQCQSASFAIADPFRMLLNYLKGPQGWTKAAVCVAASLLHGFGRQLTNDRGEELMALISDSQDPAQATAVRELLAGGSQPGGECIAAIVRFGVENEGTLLLLVRKADQAALVTRPESVRGVLRLNDKREHRQSEGFRDAWLAWMRAQVFLQFLPGIQLVSDELIDPPDIDVASDSVAPAARPAVRVTPFPQALTKKPSIMRAADTLTVQPQLRRQSPVRAKFRGHPKGIG